MRRIKLPIGQRELEATGERYIPGKYSHEVEYEHLHRYLFAAKYCREKRVLDVASGEGYGAFILSQVAKSVIGIDIDSLSVGEAQKRYPGISFRVGDCRRLPLQDASVDVVVSFETVEHIKEQEDFLREIKRVLTADGILIISSPDREAYEADRQDDNHFHEKELSYVEFQDLLGKFFTHQAGLFQKVFAGSMIVADVDASLPCNFFIKEQDEVVVNQLLSAGYNIAIASDVDLPTIKNSVYSGSDTRNFLSSLWGGIQERDASLTRLKEELAVLSQANDSLSSVNDNINLLRNDIHQQSEARELSCESYEQFQITAKCELDQLTEKLFGLSEGLSTLLTSNRRVSWRDHWRFVRMLIRRPRQALRLSRERKLVLASGLFDVFYYMTYYRDILADGIDPLSHFLTIGWREGRRPNRFFDTELYLLVNGDVRQSGVNPLVHYISYGESEGRSPFPGFDPIDYRACHRELEQVKMGALLHFIRYGSYEREIQRKELENLGSSEEFRFLDEGNYFHPSYYLRHWWNLPEGYVNPFQHFLTIGYKEENCRTAPLIRGRHFCSGDKDCLAVELQQAYELSQCWSQPIPQDYYHPLSFEEVDRPTVSVIIPVHNQWHFTYNCLRSLNLIADKVTFEVIVADDSSTDETIAMGHTVTGVRIVKNEGPRGFSANCNSAAKHARGQFLFFLNNDTALYSHALDRLVEILESDRGIGIVGSKLIFPDFSLQEAGGIVWKDGSAWNFGRGQDPERPEFSFVREVDYVSGAALMIRSELWKELGGFDETYLPAYYEDTDLCFAARERGQRVYFQPLSIVVHFEGMSNGKDVTAGVKKYQLVNKAKFSKKWMNSLKNEHFKNGEEVFLARDRSRDSKHILFIDHYIPNYDRDAGSRSVWQHILLLKELGHAVSFLPDNCLAMQPYTEMLQHQGIEVLHAPVMPEEWKDWLRANGKYLDYVILSRPDVAERYLRELRKHSKAKLIFYGHDIHYTRLQRLATIAEGEEKERFCRQAEQYQKLEQKLWRELDIISYFSEEEIEIVRGQVPQATTAKVPLFSLDANHKLSEYHPERRDLLFVGGFSHTPNIDAISWFAKEIFPKIQARLGSVKLNIIGSNPPPAVRALKSNAIEIRGWVSDAELEQAYQRCRVMVVPLRAGAGIKGKIVEGMHNGIVMVATSVALEGFSNTEEFLLPADSADEFANRVVELYSQSDLALNKLVKQQQEYIVRHFGKAVVMQALEDLLDA